jgi:hypothetical protein
MKVLVTVLCILMIGSLSLAGCNSGGVPRTTYRISGTVVNLANGGGLVLQDNLKDNLSVKANGSFTFATPIASGGSYSVTISVQPSNPAQTCGVTNRSGIATANVTNVQVNCGHNEWAWIKGASTGGQSGMYGSLGVAAMSNNPGARQTSATWTDASGNFWLFGGFGLDSTGSLLSLNDLWKYSSGEWVWMSGANTGNQIGTYGTLGVPAMDTFPGARYEAASWTDLSGNLWLFGGNGYDSTGTNGSLNDLWKYSAGEWTWMGGSNVAFQKGTYGTLGVPGPNNIPGARVQAVSWVDSSGNFWLFGGFGYDSNGTHGALNDLWKYTAGEWTWVSGSNLVNQSGVYGAQGVPAPGNVPGARNWSAGWTDSSGHLWLFGGTGYGPIGQSGFLNDLWRYKNGQWTWMSSSNLIGRSGAYGTQGVPATTNIPGARQNAWSWTDPAGNFWLFGGNAIDSAGGIGLLNDLWKYSNGEWTWMSGAKLINQNGVYGTQGALFPGNIPGARGETGEWVDANGNLWLFGGYGVAAGTEDRLDDLWMYMP